MHTVKVVESVDIEAPRDEVFDIIVNCDRRLQLSPLWGAVKVEEVTPDFPHEGSRYHVKLVAGDRPEYDTIVTAFVPSQKFAYRLTVRRETRTTWTFQDVPKGTRIIYHEEFLADETKDEEFIRSVRRVVREWLDNIRRYAELRDGWAHRLVKWLVDRYFLKMKVDQRRVVVMILALQGISCVSFVFVAIGLGIASLF